MSITTLFSDDKWCSWCKKTQSRANFNKNRRHKDGLQNHCRTCTSERGRCDYHRSPDRKEATARHEKNAGRELVAWVASLKHMNPCTDCKVGYPWFVMHWDHLRDKEESVSRMVTLRRPRKRIMAEIEKCELVCANCHAARTYDRAHPDDVAIERAS